EGSRITCGAAAWSDQRSGEAAWFSSSVRRACLPGASKTHQERRDAAVKALKRVSQLFGRHCASLTNVRAFARSERSRVRAFQRSGAPLRKAMSLGLAR